MNAPLLLEGILTIDEFVSVVAAWALRCPASIAGFKCHPPAGINHLFWEPLGFDDPNQYPLIDNLPVFPSTYRIDRLAGSGSTLDGSVFNWLIGTLRQTHPEHSWMDTWSRAFLAMNWRLESPYLLVQMPLAVGVDTRYDLADHKLTAELHFRPPLLPVDFAIRTGEGDWDISATPSRPAPAHPDRDGWNVGVYEEEVQPGGTRKVWVSRPEQSPSQFDWLVVADVGEADTPARRRSLFVEHWYSLSNQKFGADIRRRSPMPKDGQRDGPAFEVALGNACAAAGLQVIFGGGTLSTPGIDFVAFDEQNCRAYAISATTTNQINKKLEELLRIEGEIRQALERAWAVFFVIICADPSEVFLADVVGEAKRRGIVVMGEESLSALSQDPPDPVEFVMALRSLTGG